MESAYKSTKPSSFYDSLKIKQETQATVVKDPPPIKVPELPIEKIGIGVLILILIVFIAIASYIFD